MRTADPDLTEPEPDPDSVGQGLWGEPDLTEPEVESESGYKTLLSSVIESESANIERTIAIGGIAFAAVGFIVAVYASIVASWRLGVPLTLVAILVFGYFVSVRRVLAERPDFAVIRFISPVVEQLIPFAVTLVIIATQGAAYALGSWVPPILFVGITLLNLFRLRPGFAVGMGVVSSALFAITAFVMVPLLDPRPLPDTELYTTRMQLARCLTLLLVGGACGTGILILRRALGQGASRLRAVELFGKYRLGKEIAVGGMGSVIRAVYCPEGGFERPVAIKRIHAHLSRDKRFVDSFRNEAELCARLLHPNIVQVLDFGRAHGTYFFAMEYVDGANLAQLIAKARAGKIEFPTRLVVQIGIELGEALHFAHAVARAPDGGRLRIVHRDVNPRNVLLSRSGEVKLADFGIARELGEQSAHETRHMMGSLAYLAPEQARGERIHERTDLFSLGLVLHELLTLRSVFDRPTDIGTLRAVVDAPIPDVREVRSDVSPGLARLLGHALQRDPARRFPSAADMVEALKTQLEAEGVPGPDELKDFVETLMRVADSVPPREGNLRDGSLQAVKSRTTEGGMTDIHGMATQMPDLVDSEDDDDATHLDLKNKG